MPWGVGSPPRPVGPIVVLGCRVRLDADGAESVPGLCRLPRLLRPGALSRRLDAAAAAYFAAGDPDVAVVVSGGRRWGDAVEADVMALELHRRGVPATVIVRERCSLSTSDNARFTAALLARRGLRRVTLVTSAWHMPRALLHFRRVGLDPEAFPSPGDGGGVGSRLWRWGRERVLMWALLFVLGCSSGGSPRATPVEAAATPPAQPLATIARAENLRLARDLPSEAQASHDPAIRRAAARALARILDGDDGPLLRALEDDDPQVVTWAAYGLGESCKGREDVHVRAIGARLASAADGPAVVAMLRALGRCGGDAGEQTLRQWLAREPASPEPDAALVREDAEAAAFALGELSARRRAISPESAGALLDAAGGSPPLDSALYAFGRTEGVLSPDVRRRVAETARAALGRAGPSRVFAVRALARAADADTASDLAKILASNEYTAPERVDAAHGLARLRRGGQGALARVLGALVPPRGAGLRGDRFGVLLAALDAVADDPSDKVESALWAMARLEPPPDAPPAEVRRASSLRCRAAEKLARGAWDTDVVTTCDLGDGSARDLAQLDALDRGALAHSRKTAWARLASSPYVRVREAALKLIARHPELGESGVAALASALTATEPGVAATAADVIQGHPDRVLVVAAAERRAALDPRAPLPSGPPAKEIDPSVAHALAAALERSWGEDLVEARASVLEAALAVELPQARAAAAVACGDSNATIRARAQRALEAAGEKGASCPLPVRPGAAAPELGGLLASVERVVLETDGGSLALRVDPAFAPIAATRIVALARSGFYTGIAVHRVVSGFVVQLGDRGGDGFGGSGALLRCETSPVPFGALDVGMALAGRDTGSSQFFVTLARYPHLDGAYAWLGRAEGDWDAVAEGDVVTAVRVEP